jgi:hypothetical protein
VVATGDKAAVAAVILSAAAAVDRTADGEGR